MLCPFEGNAVRVTQGFTLGYHNGMDVVGVNSYRLIAIGDGTVSAVVNLDVHYTSPLATNRTREWGTFVKLTLDDGTLVYYCHMEYNSPVVKVGQRVSKGDIIGTMGNTGYSFGAHCHLEIRSAANVVTSAINTATYTEIPNAVGIYYDEEEEAMTATEKEYVKGLEKRIAELEDRTSVKYSWLEGKNDVVPKWALKDIKYLYQKGFLKGTETGSLALSYIELRVLCVVSRIAQKILK